MVRRFPALLSLVLIGGTSLAQDVAEANAARTIAEWERGLPALKLNALVNEI